MSAEGRLTPGLKQREIALQWSRAAMSAEGFCTSVGMDVQRRASMEPRCDERGSAAERRWHARLPSASIEPRCDERGRGRQAATR